MFWGLTLKANKRYSQTLKKAFHLSNAVLDVPSSDNELVQVTLTHEGNNYIICNLRKNKVEQVSVDLSFQKGEEISFTSQGNGNVHLTGYLLLDDEEFDDLEDEDMEELIRSAEENPGKKKKQKGKKGKLNESSDAAEENEDEDDDDSELDDTFEAEDDDEDDDDEEGEEEEDDDDDESDEEVQEPKSKQIKLDKSKPNGLENGQVVAKDKKEKKKEKQKQQQQQKQEKSPKGGEKTLQGGVKIEDLQVGNGPEAKPGKKVFVYYEGRLKQNNKVFDSTKDGKGFKFGLGKGEVIKGWDIGVAGMKVGGKRRITCPPHMAYGPKGHPPVIPPNSTLVFDVELKNIN